MLLARFSRTFHCSPLGLFIKITGPTYRILLAQGLPLAVGQNAKKTHGNVDIRSTKRVSARTFDFYFCLH